MDSSCLHETEYDLLGDQYNLSNNKFAIAKSKLKYCEHVQYMQ